MTNAIAGVTGIVVACIKTERKRTCLQIAEHFLSIEYEKRSDAMPVFGRHTRQAQRSRSAEEIEKEGFCLIIFLMTESDGIEAMFFGEILKKGVTKIPENFFIALSGIFGIALDETRESILLCQRFDKLFIGYRIGASQLVVDVSDSKLERIFSA